MKGYLRGGLLAMATTLRNALRRPTTVEFPDVIRPRAERYRSSFALLHEADGDEACIGCLQCERICPSEVISIKVGGKRESPVTGKKRGYADDFVLDLNGCIYCELCVQVCPTDAIVMTREPELPAYGREDLVLTMAKLYANEKSKPRAWGDATRLNAMQTPPKPPAAPKPAPAPSGAAPAGPTPSGGPAPVPKPAAPSGAASAGPTSSGAPAPVATPVGPTMATAPGPSSAAAAPAVGGPPIPTSAPTGTSANPSEPAAPTPRPDGSGEGT
jgi:NADH-quinone oxidoreductase subunit I